MHKDRFIPIRFLSLTIQTILTILIFTNLDKHVAAASWQERQVSQSFQFQLRVQLIVSLSLSLFFNLIEYFGMFSGISTFAYSQVVISSLCHCTGSVLVILFHLEQWSSQYFWFVFGFCSLLPFLTECLVWLRVLVFHRNVYLLGQ